MVIAALLVGGLCWPAVGQQEGGAGGDEPRVISAFDYDRIRVLRESAGLTTEDLALLDLSEDQVTTILEGVYQWYFTHRAALLAQDQRQIEAQRALRKARRALAAAADTERPGTERDLAGRLDDRRAAEAAMDALRAPLENAVTALLDADRRMTRDATKLIRGNYTASNGVLPDALIERARDLVAVEGGTDPRELGLGTRTLSERYPSLLQTVRNVEATVLPRTLRRLPGVMVPGDFPPELREGLGLTGVASDVQ